MRLQGKISIEHVRPNIESVTSLTHNMVVDVGAQDALSVQFRSVPKQPNYYLGLIDAEGFDVLSRDDIEQLHLGWQEFTEYTGGATETQRIEWVPVVADIGKISTADDTVFSITADGDIRGLILSPNAEKGPYSLGETVGPLWGQAKFPRILNLLLGDVLKVRYEIVATRS